MNRLLRMLKGAFLGTLFGLAVGVGFSAVVLFINLPFESPMDRWYHGVRIIGIILGGATIVGLIAGLASRVSEDGLTFFKSIIIVSVASIVAIFFAHGANRELFLLIPLIGAMIGGIVVAVAGIATSKSHQNTKQENKTANQA